MAYPELIQRKKDFKALESMTLFTLTRDLHHHCEDTPVGQAMSRGDISVQWWADWVASLLLIHKAMAEDSPEKMCCVDELADDLQGLNVAPRKNRSAIRLANNLKCNSDMRIAAQYVLVGAHLTGGQVMRKRIGNRLPTGHLNISQRDGLKEEWSPLRERVDLAEEARDVFRGLYAIVTEIPSRDEEARHG